MFVNNASIKLLFKIEVKPQDLPIDGTWGARDRRKVSEGSQTHGSRNGAEVVRPPGQRVFWPQMSIATTLINASLEVDLQGLKFCICRCGVRRCSRGRPRPPHASLRKLTNEEQRAPAPPHPKKNRHIVTCPERVCLTVEFVRRMCKMIHRGLKINK